MSYNPKVLGGILLVAGTTIGAGMLALPVTTGLSGFIPSVALFIVCFLFMLASLFLLLEANLYSKELDANIITMAGEHLGCRGQIVAWFSFLLLLYAVMAAYMSGGSAFLTHLIQAHVYINMTSKMGVVFFASLVAVVVFCGTRWVDYVNRIMVISLFVSYLWLVFFGLPKVKFTNLTSIGHLPYLWSAVPVVALSFTSHLILPSLRSYFGKELKGLKYALLYGAILPLLFYLVWQIFVLGILPYHGNSSLSEVVHANDSVNGMILALKYYVHLPGISIAVGCFSFFAIITSFLGVSLSLVDFLADGFGWDKNKLWQHVLLLLASFLPPLWFALYFTKGFILALGYGGVFIAILYGILPVLMVWRARYQEKKQVAYRLFGGKGILLIIFVGACVIIMLELATALHLVPMP